MEKSYSTKKNPLTVHEQAYYNKKIKSTFFLNKKGKIWEEQSVSDGG